MFVSRKYAYQPTYLKFFFPITIEGCGIYTRDSATDPLYEAFFLVLTTHYCLLFTVYIEQPIFLSSHCHF